MRLEIKYGDRATLVEIRRGEEADVFHLALEKEDGSVETLDVRLLSRSGDRWTLDLGGRVEDLLLSANLDGAAVVEWDQRTFPLQIRDLRQKLFQSAAAPEMAASSTVKAQMPGKVIEVLKKAGDSVEAGQGLVIIESMKMQNELQSPTTGVIAHCGVAEGGSVNAGDILYRIEAP